MHNTAALHTHTAGRPSPPSLPELFISLNRSSHFPTPASGTSSPLCLWNLTSLGPHTSGVTVFVLLCQSYATWQNAPRVHPHCSVCQNSFPFKAEQYSIIRTGHKELPFTIPPTWLGLFLLPLLPAAGPAPVPGTRSQGFGAHATQTPEDTLRPSRPEPILLRWHHGLSLPPGSGRVRDAGPRSQEPGRVTRPPAGVRGGVTHSLPPRSQVSDVLSERLAKGNVTFT